MKISSSPSSRWIDRYKRRYVYTLGGFLMFIGLITLPLGGIGLAFLIPGIVLIYLNSKFNLNKKEEKCQE